MDRLPLVKGDVQVFAYHIDPNHVGHNVNVHALLVPSVIETLVSLTRDSLAYFPPARAGALDPPGRDTRATPAIVFGNADRAEHWAAAGRGSA
jgi:hypothetical protein